MHNIGNLTVINNKITNKMTKATIEHPSMIINIETGTVLKYGDTDWMERYYQEICTKYMKAGLNAETFVFIKFETYLEKLDIHHICTMMNYMCNSISAKQMKELFAMKEMELKTKLEKLQELGF